MTIIDVYRNLFGKGGIQDGNVIDMAEHQRIGDVSTGQGYKAVRILDDNGDPIASFGGGTQYTEGDTDTTITGTAIMWEDAGDTLEPVSAASPLPVEIVAGAGSGGTAAADDADFTAGTTSGTPAMGVFESSPTSVTDGDMGIVGMTADRKWKTSAFAAGGSLSVFQAGSAWQVTMATLPVMARAVGGSISSYVFGGSLSSFNAGGSLSAFQGGAWNVFASMASGTNYISGGQYLPTLASLSSLQHTNHKTDMFSNLMVNTNVPLPNSTRLNRFYTLASNASLMATPGAGRRLVVRELDYSANATVSLRLVEDQGGTPATIWGPHYFPPNGGITKTNCYIATTANKSLGLTIVGVSDSTIDLRVETENV